MQAIRQFIAAAAATLIAACATPHTEQSAAVQNTRESAEIRAEIATFAAQPTHPWFWLVRDRMGRMASPPDMR
jgi:glutaredoxin-related protein